MQLQCFVNFSRAKKIKNANPRRFSSHFWKWKKNWISKNDFVSVQKSTNTNSSMMKNNEFHRISPYNLHNELIRACQTDKLALNSKFQNNFVSIKKWESMNFLMLQNNKFHRIYSYQLQNQLIRACQTYKMAQNLIDDNCLIDIYRSVLKNQKWIIGKNLWHLPIRYHQKVQVWKTSWGLARFANTESGPPGIWV